MKLKNILSLCFLILLFNANAQTTKGLKVISKGKSDAPIPSKTYALIIGISKYQDTAIPSLEFADKDAIAFYNYCITTGIDTNNITLRLNENAKSGRLWMDILTLAETASKGDRIYFYFSGHGDVESKTLMHDAYLLTYDTPKNMYVATSIPVYQLQNYLATFSAKGVEVIFICDACHSGNLSGGREGMQAAAAVLKDVWKDEIKILSCQPGELSIEGKQWGNGRGLFSYELINGMAGLADRNKDGKISLKELNLYLLEKVSDEATPAIQNPIVNGNMETQLSKVNVVYLNTIVSSPPNSLFASVDSKGFEESLLNTQPDTIKKLYALFKSSMESGDLTLSDYEGRDYKKEYAAYEYLSLIPDNDSTKLLKGIMKRNLAAEMINAINHVIDEVVDNSFGFNYGSPFEGGGTYFYYDQLFSLLGKQKILELGLMPKLVFREAIRLNRLDSSESYVLTLLDSALKMNTKASYILAYYTEILINQDRNKEARDMAIRTINISPKFAYPYRLLSSSYRRLNKPDSAINVCFLLLKLDSFFAPSSYRHLALSYFLLNLTDSVDFYFNKYYQTNNYKKDTMKILDSYNLLAAESNQHKRYEAAIAFNESEIKILEAGNKTELIIRFEESQSHYSRSTSSIISIRGNLYNIACCYSLMNDKPNALEYLEMSIQKGYKEFDWIQSDTDLDNIRFTPEFKKLMKKYFPDKIK